MTTVMCDMFFFARLIVDQSHTRAAERCSAPGSTCEVRMPERVACRSPPAQAARLAWARRPRLRRRRTLFSWVWCDVPGEEIIAGMERRGLFDCIAESSVVVGAQLAPSRAPDLALGQDVRDCASCPFCRGLAPPWLVHGQAFEGVVKDGAGKRGARLRLDAALEAAEDGHVAGLQVRGNVARMAANVASLAWMLAMSQRRIHDCPSQPGLSTSSRAAASCRIVVVVAQPFSDVTWRVRSGQGFSGKTASVLPACTICTSMSSEPRSMLKAI